MKFKLLELVATRLALIKWFPFRQNVLHYIRTVATHEQYREWRRGHPRQYIQSEVK